jgi:hypothetical protein
MHGTQCAQFATEVLRRGAAAVLPQHLPDRWLDALLKEADLFDAEEGDPEEEGDSEDRGCAGLLGAVLVLVSAQRGHPPEMEIATTTLMAYCNCYIGVAVQSVLKPTISLARKIKRLESG